MTEVDNYISNLSIAEQRVINRIRNFVRSLEPGAEECISYGLPAFKYNDKYLIGFAAHKNFLSIYPTSAPIDELKQDLKGYKFSRGAIQFTIDNLIPDKLLEKVVLIRLNNIRER